jgi:hypothetical protein
MKTNYWKNLATISLMALPLYAGCRTPEETHVEAEYRTMSVDFRCGGSRDVEVKVIPAEEFGSLESKVDK